MSSGFRGHMRSLANDPRFFQIASLSGLLAYGIAGLDFDVTPARVGVVLAAALAVQAMGQRLAGLTPFEPRSALISSLSLCLLLRTESHLLAALAAALAVGSKFALRVRGKHVFNPTNLAIAAAVLLSGRAWVSPGQWGDSAFFAFLLACGGGLVAWRALRSDVALAFLVAWAGLLFGRALWLGDPLAIPLHQLESGSLLLFAFFMVSDPKTTPDTRGCRLIFGALVAALAYHLQFVLYRPSGGLVLALFALSPLVPVLDRFFPGPRYAWPGTSKGTGHAQAPSPASSPVGSAFASPAPSLVPAPAPSPVPAPRLALGPGPPLRSGA